MTAKLFEAALGIAAPWSVGSVEFDEVAKLLTVLVDLAPGTRFAIYIQSKLIWIAKRGRTDGQSVVRARRCRVNLCYDPFALHGDGIPPAPIC